MVSLIRPTKMVVSVLVISKSVSFFFQSEFYIFRFIFLKAERENCEECNGHGKCVSEPTTNQRTCECNKWFAGNECQINLKGKLN